VHWILLYRKFGVNLRRVNLRFALPIYPHLVLIVNVGKVFAPPSLFLYF